MRRRRMINPKGLVLEMTVVLMFHSKFLTRNDKAYHIECMYVEISQKVTNRLDISALPSTEISERIGLSEANLPKCIYEVLNNDENGHAISFATIGQPVYHRWTCHSRTAATTSLNNAITDEESPGEERLYCLTVHSCEVDDGQGNVQKLLDSNGCPMDKTLLDEIEYKSDLEAGRKGFVFKFADRPTLYFGCQLKLELKSEWNQVCKRTSENCKALAALSAQQRSTSSGQLRPDSIRLSTSINPLEQIYSTPLPAQWKPTGKGNPTAQEVTLGGANTASSSDNAPDQRLTENAGSGAQIPLDLLNVNGEQDEDEEGEDNQETTSNDSSQSVLGYEPTTSSTLTIKRRTRSSTFRPGSFSGATSSHLSSVVEPNQSMPLKDYYSPQQSQAVESGRHSKKITRLIHPDSAERVSGARASSSGVATAAQTSRSAFLGDLPSVDLDVTAREVDVLDITQISMQDTNPYNRRDSKPFARDFLEPTQQICVSRQTLSVSVFGAILILLLLITLFCCVLFRLKNSTTGAMVMLPRVSAANRSRSTNWKSKHSVLNAYSSA